MPEVILTIHHSAGLHARPAAMFVQTANQYKSIIKVRYGEREVNGKSIMGILTLACEKGSKILLICDGKDEKDALAALRKILEGQD